MSKYFLLFSFFLLSRADNLPMNPPRNRSFSKYSTTSPIGLRNLVLLEWDIHTAVKFHHDNFGPKLKMCGKPDVMEVKRYLDEFDNFGKKHHHYKEMVQRRDRSFARKLALNPLAIYKIILRFRQYFYTWSKGNYKPISLRHEVATTLESIYNISEGPLEDDLNQTMFSIIKLQLIYELEINDVVNGIIHGVDTNVTLNAWDCFRIGQEGAIRKFYVSGIQWLEHAEYLVKYRKDESVTLKMIKTAMEQAKTSHDEGFKMVPSYHLFTKQFSQVQNHSEMVPRRSMQFSTFDKYPFDPFNANHLLWRVCNDKVGKIFSTEDDSRKICWYEMEIHPSFKIGPVKVELHASSPHSQVVQYHDVLAQSDMNALKRYTLKNSKHKSNLDLDFLDPAVGELMAAYEPDSSYEESIRATQLMERLTGFKILAVKDAPVYYFVYTPGSAQAKHFDSWDAHERIILATFMFYLTDVDGNGETVFPRKGIKVTPKKGSGILWYNFYSDGELDLDTNHGSCPITFGEKWIIGRSIFYNHQHHLKCNLQPKTPVPTLVNGRSIKS